MATQNNHYLIIRNLLYSIDNGQRVPDSLKQDSSVRIAREYCEAIENGTLNQFMPQYVKDRKRLCEKCGWWVLDVQRLQAPATYTTTTTAPAALLIPICVYPINPLPDVLYSYCIDVDFDKLLPTWRGNGNGMWVVHSTLCGQPRPDNDPTLAKVWDACKADADDYANIVAHGIARLDDIGRELDDL